jgi:GT2 family glycosyltransferase
VAASDVAVSIVIPTRNRRPSVERALRALAAQAFPPEHFEIIVVDDGSTDGTASVGRAAWPIAVRVLTQETRGAAAARNHGASAASGRLLLFLDDDIEAGAGMVAAHVAAHAGGNSARVVIGYLPPELQGRNDLFAVMLRAWWEAMFERMRKPGYRFVYSDLLSGNFSVHRSLFEQVGGFDDSLRCHEDYELGLRLLAAGARFAFAPEAAGAHHEHTTLERALGRKREEGRADVALARRYPALAAILPLASVHPHLSRRGRVLKHLAFTSPALGDLLAASCQTAMRTLERHRLRTRWRRMLDELLVYWYSRGVAEALAGTPLSALLETSAPAPQDAADLDLHIGLEAAMQWLDATAPAALRLKWGATVIGEVPVHPAAEPLQGRHLPLLLREPFAKAFSSALAHPGQPSTSSTIDAYRSA